MSISFIDESEYRQALESEVARLREAVQRLLNDSWNGPIDADHPARAKGADALAAAKGENT